VEAYDTPIESLVGKSLGDVEFVRLWRAHGGEVLDRNRPAVEAINGVLSTVAIVERLRRAGPGRLVITPLLEPSLGVAGVDLRLGATFITFSRSGTASFDPLNESDDPRTMQFAIEKEWGEPFILHPGELVLAATLEYMALPDDLSAQVITRSSYGRLGLITATAIQVHPHFKGCLTLELVNLGEVPIELIPGERIAQLTFATVSPPAAEAKGKYSYPVGPEFSRVRTDAEATVLRRLRHEARHRYEARTTP
jgi:deoxycytidine triphosphate deaminase